MSKAAVLAVLALLLPAAAAAAGGPPPEALLGELPFLDSDEDNRIYVDLAPEGSARPLRILLDTGASFSVFSPRAAREAGVRVRKLKSSPYQRATRLGRDLFFVVDTSSSDQGTRMGWEYGLLGCNFLEHYVVELDFAGRKVRFYDPDRFAVPEAVEAPDETVIPMPLNGCRPLWDVDVDGTTVRFVVDTGAPDSLGVAGSMARKAGIEPALGEMRAGMIIGPVAMKLGEAAQVRIGSQTLEGVPLLVVPRGHYNWAGPNDSLLGFDVLAEFTVRLDFEHHRAWLKRRPDARRTLYGGDWSAFRSDGVLVVRDGAFHVVAAVREDSPAAERGVREGDRLLEGQKPGDFLAELRGGGELMVARERDGVWIDTPLAAATADASAAP